MTEEEEKKVVQTLLFIWDYCGDDLLVDEYGKPDYSVVMTRDDVFTTCVDMMFARGDNPIPLKTWHSLTEEEKTALKLKAFPHSNYGW